MFIKFVAVVLLIHFPIRVIVNGTELQAISESSKERIDGTYVGYEGLLVCCIFDMVVRKSLRCSQQGLD